jgi:hypothetical protein
MFRASVLSRSVFSLYRFTKLPKANANLNQYKRGDFWNKINFN